jgi:flagellar biosynthesis component FlhA
VARHVEFVVCQYLPLFLKLEDLDYTGHRLCADAYKDLWLVQRRLLRERVPITDPQEIARKHEDLWRPGCELIPIAEEIRLARPNLLPGNNRSNRLLRLSPDFEQALKEGLICSVGSRKTFLVLRPEIRARLLRSLRRAITAGEAYRTSLIATSELRPFIAWLTKNEFPLLAVLAERELGGDLQASIGGEILYGS